MQTDTTRWTAAVGAVSALLIAPLCLTLWWMPFPVTEAVAIFEDIVNAPPTRFFNPDTAYYRPLFHVTIAAIWHNAETLNAQLSLIRLLHIVPVVLLVTALLAHLRPRTRVDAGAAAVAIAVLVGSPGFRDNLELPLSYTIVGMPLALIAWLLLNREPRWWHQPALIGLTVVAVGFKEQGLVIVPIVLAAWWMRAPGARGWTAALLAALAVTYVAFRLEGRQGQSLPMFEQAVGLWFGEMEPAAATARFGDFPYLIYAYNGVSTIFNVLFAEPTRGTFSILRSLVDSRPEPWQIVHLWSSAALTAVIGWWALRAWRHAARDGWTPDARLAVVLAVALLASGVLSFNYSRDRLGGMAVPFYALAAFWAMRAAATRAHIAAPRRRLVIMALLLTIAGGWTLRAVGTIERTRLGSVRNQMEWLQLLPGRRIEFAQRPTYLRIMHSMIPQGTAPDIPRPTPYPAVVRRLIGDLPLDPPFPRASSLADAIAMGDIHQAHAFIRAGQDPNDPIVVRHPELTGGNAVSVSPVLWATATRRPRVLQMLLAFGARLERPAERRAVCLADAVGADDIARVLEVHDPTLADEPCEPLAPGRPPLPM